MLQSIKTPGDLHKLTIAELNELAREIRRCIIDTVEINGGHLGANLGVVELTLALHSELNSPADKIVWDVGHQSYPHKLLTGRFGQFSTLRQWDGISGYPRREESVHDAFSVGHSSTSISALAGMAIARDLRGEKNVVVAVIGDGALSGGMAFEALNHLGSLKKNAIVVLNDNKMSIARNVGALSDYLNRLRIDPTLSRAREELDGLVKRIPAIGPPMSRVAGTLKDAVKSLLPGQLFEELGFTYVGPFDGHNVSQLKKAIRDGVSRGGPVLIHVLTQKGKGYAPAEKNPAKFHGISPAPSPGVDETSEQTVSYSRVFGKTLEGIAETNMKVVAITAAMKDGTGLSGFARRYPNRFFDVGIAEQHGITLAAGMASQGLKPVVALYSTFLQRAYDQVLHDICLQNLPVVIGIDRAGVVGDDGPTHHGLFEISFLRSIPNLTLLSPSSGRELAAMLEWAISHNGPVAIRYPRAETTLERLADLGEDVLRARVLRQGDEVVIIAVGNMVSYATEAAELLKPAINCSVVDARVIKPLDVTTLRDAIQQAKWVFTVEDHVCAGGFGSCVLEALRSHTTAEIHCLGYPDEFVPQGSIAEIHKHYRLDSTGIAGQIMQFVEEGRMSIIGKTAD